MTSSTFRLARLPSPPAPLPIVPGPKLAPFTPTAYADNIEFVEFLGNENDKDSLVWKVMIDGAGPFALKVFYFRHWRFLRKNQGLTEPLASPQLYVEYFDPFNCECRAYGRLKAERREDLAVKAHGYLFLTSQQDADLAFQVTGRRTPPPSTDADILDHGNNFWNRQEQHRGLPVRAIVKDLVARTNPDPVQARDMWPDLQALHSLGIFVMDTHWDNYEGGKLVDFSRAWTMYHPALDQIRARAFRGLLLDELQSLLDYYYLLTNSSSGAIAVPEDLEALCSGDLDRYQNFPGDYDWFKYDKDADVAKADGGSISGPTTCPSLGDQQCLAVPPRTGSVTEDDSTRSSRTG